MKSARQPIIALLVATQLVACISSGPRHTSAPPSFEEGIVALNKKDFPLASYHFSALAKEGDPSSMNNLGVALLMVDRRDEATYWLKSATRYGDPNAPQTLSKLGESIPAADLVGQHPAQLAREATEKFIAAVAIGALVGVTAYYAGKGSGGYSDYSNLLKSDDASGLSGIKQGAARGIAAPQRESIFRQTTQSGGREAGGSVNTRPSSSVTQSEDECSSDYSCGTGRKCVKQAYSSRGVCMRSVNEYGVQTYTNPDPKSIEIKTKGNCTFDTDCPPGFKCDWVYKACVK